MQKLACSLLEVKSLHSATGRWGHIPPHDGRRSPTGVSATTSGTILPTLWVRFGTSPGFQRDRPVQVGGAGFIRSREVSGYGWACHDNDADLSVIHGTSSAVGSRSLVTVARVMPGRLQSLNDHGFVPVRDPMTFVVKRDTVGRGVTRRLLRRGARARFEAAVKDADEAVADLAQGRVVAGFAGALLVVVAAGTGRAAQRGERLERAGSSPNSASTRAPVNSAMPGIERQISASGCARKCASTCPSSSAICSFWLISGCAWAVVTAT
jgi:hypothetical protein